MVGIGCGDVRQGNVKLTHMKFVAMELLEYIERCKQDVLHRHGNLGNLI